MKKLSLALCLVLAGSLILNSCKKKEDDEAAPSKSAMLAGTWKLSAATVDPAFFGITDFYAIMEACDKDDLMKIKSDKTYTFTQGATKCNSSDPDLKDSGTWMLTSDGKQLTIDSDSSGAETYDVKTLTSSSLSITYMEYDSLTSKNYTFTQSFAKQ